MSIDRLLAQWRLDSSIANSLVVWHEIPAQSARKLRFPDELHPSLTQGLNSLEIDASVYASSCQPECCSTRSKHGRGYRDRKRENPLL